MGPAMSPPAHELAAVAIYDGREHIGDVHEVRPGRFEAADASGRGLGVFPSMLAARHAVLAASRSNAP